MCLSFTRLLEKEIIPLLRKQKGFQDEITIAISFWDKQDNAEAHNYEAYLDVLKVLSKVVEKMLVVETFEVASSTFHKIAANAV